MPARAVYRAALRAVDPARLVREALGRVRLPRASRIVLVGAGKASAAMALAVEDVLGSRISGGVVLAVEGTERKLRYADCLPCGHPVPDRRSVEGTRRLLQAVSGLSRDDLVLACWSGGGSACLGLPVPGVRLAEVVETTRRLLSRRVPIHEINRVRRGLLMAGDGGVARAAAPARVLALLLCDASPGDVASGPTWAPRNRRVRNVVIGDNATAVRAAARKARELGYVVETVSPLRGEAGVTGARLARRLKGMARGRALVAGGETTMAVRGRGRGGRNQELALGAALELRGVRGVALLAGATDGVDGNSDAAGALVTGETCRSDRDAALARRALRENDSHAFFLGRPERLVTGPTGTNAADLVVGLSAAARGEPGAGPGPRGSGP